MNRIIQSIFIGIFMAWLTALSYAGIPAIKISPLTSTKISVPANSSAIIKYVVTNQSPKPHILQLMPIPGISQITTGAGVCGQSFALPGKGISCTLWLKVLGNQLNDPISSGPRLCEQGNALFCYDANPNDVLQITQAPPVTSAGISVTGSPIHLIQNGGIGTLTITNNSQDIAATNISSHFGGTALNGFVTESGNTCNSIPINGTCTLSYTPGNTVVPLTTFTISGTNTNTLTASMAIDQASPTLTSLTPTSGQTTGGASLTLTGTYFTNATDVTFGGVSGTSLTVINDTTVTIVTPAHAAGSVDVVITTPGGTATLTNGFTYNSSPTVSNITPINGPTSGGTGFTITGTNLTGTTSVTIGGNAATSINVLNATTLTGVTPVNTAGSKNIVVTSPQGSGTLTNGFTYLAPAIGQLTNGGYIGCLGGSSLNQFIIATSDISNGIRWGSPGAVGTSSTNGLTSTNSIYTFMTGQGLNPNSYAAGLCYNYEVDSQGNTPCQAGNQCYNDWFLPARFQLSCICNNTHNLVPNLGFNWGTLYWTSTQIDNFNIYGYQVVGGVCSENGDNFPSIYPVRCARYFTP